jgi:hypothetical protein
MELDVNSLFDIKNRNLSGDVTDGIISSHDFIRQGVKIIDKNKMNDKLPYLIHEYSLILKYIIKQEMISEMKKSIKSIETFYN